MYKVNQRSLIYWLVLICGLSPPLYLYLLCTNVGCELLYPLKQPLHYESDSEAVLTHICRLLALMLVLPLLKYAPLPIYALNSLPDCHNYHNPTQYTWCLIWQGCIFSVSTTAPWSLISPLCIIGTWMRNGPTFLSCWGSWGCIELFISTLIAKTLLFAKWFTCRCLLVK